MLSDINAYSNINVKLNNKIPVVLHNLKNYDSHLIMQELMQELKNSFLNKMPCQMD